MSPVAVIRVGEQHHDVLAEFYRQVWNPDATADAVASSRANAARVNLAHPGEAPPTWLVMQDGRAIAHVTTIPVEGWINGSERPAYWIKGLWVLPEFQRSSAGFLLLRALSDLHDPTFALVHEPAAVRLFQAVGYLNLGPLPNAMKLLNARSFLSRIDLDSARLQTSALLMALVRMASAGAAVIGPTVTGGLWAWSTLGSGPLVGLTTDLVDNISESEIDELWKTTRTEIAGGPSRSGRQLIGKYPSPAYVCVTVRSRGRLRGIAFVKRPRESGDARLHGLRIATLSDLLFRPSDARAGLALLRGAEQAARKSGADALLCSASAAIVNNLGRRRGYVRLPANLHVLARDGGSAASRSSLPALGEWWFTRGDSEADGAF